jgi:hypothetical protein
MKHKEGYCISIGSWQLAQRLVHVWLCHCFVPIFYTYIIKMLTITCKTLKYLMWNRTKLLSLLISTIYFTCCNLQKLIANKSNTKTIVSIFYVRIFYKIKIIIIQISLLYTKCDNNISFQILTCYRPETTCLNPSQRPNQQPFYKSNNQTLHNWKTG